MTEPKLRFKADDGSKFPEWEEKTLFDVLDDVVDFRGRTPKKLGMDWCPEKTDYLALSALNVKMGYIDDSVEPHYGDSILYRRWMNGKELYKGEVLFTTEAPMGNVAQVPDNKPYILSQRVIALIPVKDVICDDFFCCVLQSRIVQLYLKKLATGGTAQGISQKSLEKLRLTFPSLSEQQKIASFLSSIDEIIQSTESELTAWQKRKKGVMQKIFNREVRFKADDGSEFTEWEEKRLGEEGQFYGGLSGKGKDDFGCGEGRFLTYMNIYKNAFAKRDIVDNVNVEKTEKQNSVQYGDILFTQSSETVEEVGLSSVYLYDDKPYLNSFCMGFRFNDLRNVCPEFIGYCMRSENIRKSIMLMGQGISRINLGAKRLATVKYELPPLPEQKKIAECLSSVDCVIRNIQAELSAWKEFKKGLLQQMFV
jgi:type I restriction enzyme S subunit